MLSVFSSHLVHASDLERIPDGTKLLILGKGITPRGYNRHNPRSDALFLACVGDEGIPCGKIRAVRLLETLGETSQGTFEYVKTLYWYGEPLELVSQEEATTIQDQSSADRLVKKRLKALYRQFAKMRGKNLKGPLLGVAIVGGFAFGAVGSVPIAFLLGPAAVDLFWSGVLAGSVTLVVLSTFNSQSNVTGQKAKSMSLQEGWNWSLEPRKVPKSYYGDFNRFVLNRYSI